MQITILEFAPCVDWLYHLHRDEEDGYLTGDGDRVTVKSGAKLRPRVAGIYAGGKATNVARVMDKLLDEEDRADVELVVFLPDSAEGRYIHELQQQALRRVRTRPLMIEGQARLCVDLVDPSTPQDQRVEFNISPRVVWKEHSLDQLYHFADTLSTDVFLMAGNPPLIETPDGASSLPTRFYTQIIEQARSRVPVISVDMEKQNLENCLRSYASPDVIKINHQERAWVDKSLWDNFRGTLVVTDAEGCVIQENQIQRRVGGVPVETLYSTIGAGDAVHAGFTLARWVRGFDAVQAARYGQAAAAAAVSASDGTRGVDKATVENFFARLQNEEGAKP